MTHPYRRYAYTYLEQCKHKPGFATTGHKLTEANQKSFLPEASFGLRVLSLPGSVCLCIRLYVR